jgi:4-amino-4-deoxy-L-arabinose transferase-like glycosyltransferase
MADPMPIDRAATTARRWNAARFAGRVGVPLFLAIAVLWQAALFRQTTSGVYDEKLYLDLGLAAFQHGDFRLMEGLGVAPLPVLLSYWLPARAFPDGVSPAAFPEAIRLARLSHAILVGLPLVLLPYVWMARRRGCLAAAIVGGLLAFSPNVVAFAALATTDATIVVCSLLALAALAHYAAAPSALRVVGVGLALGLALSAKYSALFLLPVIFVVLVASHRSRRPAAAARKPRAGLLAWTVIRAAALTALLALLALGIVWMFYGFSRIPPFTRTWPEPGSVSPALAGLVDAGRTTALPAPIKGLIVQVAHASTGQDAFLMGARSTKGWWYYYPAAWLFKSTPAELVLTLALPLLLWFGRIRENRTAQVWLLALLALGGASLASSLDLGVRYILLLYFLLALSVVDLAADRLRTRLVCALALPLLLLQAGSAASTAPRHLSYFNGVFTRPGTAHERLADSNLDWGQDLPALKAELDRLGAHDTVLAYFGLAPVEAYGVIAVPWDSRDDRRVAECQCVAISATLLDGVSVPNDPFYEFRLLRPDARAGDSVFLYSLARGDVRRALAIARQRR